MTTSSSSPGAATIARRTCLEQRPAVELGELLGAAETEAFARSGYQTADPGHSDADATRQDVPGRQTPGMTTARRTASAASSWVDDGRRAAEAVLAEIEQSAALPLVATMFIDEHAGSHRRKPERTRMGAVRLTDRARPVADEAVRSAMSAPRSHAVTEEHAVRQTSMSILEAVHPRVERDNLEGFEAVTLAAGALEATFVPSLGMVGASLRHAGEELLDRRTGLRAYRDMGTVTGVPLLHPWANRLARDELILGGHRVRLPGPPAVWRDERGLPIHGLLGAHPGWSVHEADADGHAARLIARLDFAADPWLTALFPFPHDLVLEATLSAGSLRIATTVRATGAVPVPIAFGYHPYLRIPRVSRADWHVHLPARRHLALDELAIPTGGGSWASAVDFRLADASFDDGYDSIEDGAVFAVAGGGREIRVTFDAGFPAAQVFTPPRAPFICFEPMTAPTNALCSGVGLRHVAPDAAFTAAFTIGVS